jgi:hypothetical protein
VITALLSGVAPPTEAQTGRGISVVRRGAVRRAVDAGDVVSVVFRIASEDHLEHAVRPRVELPPTWRLLLPEPPFVLGARTEEIHLVSVAVPATAAAGPHVVRYMAGLSDGSTVADSALFEVRQHRALTASVDVAPTLAIADSSFEVVFRVRNAGNVSVRFTPRIRSRSGFGLRVSPLACDLGAGASATIVARVETRRAKRPPLQSGIVERLELLGDSLDRSPVVPMAVALVHVYPHSTQTAVPSHSLPAELVLHGSPQAMQSGIVELSARGALRDGGSTRAQLFIRRPITSFGRFAPQGSAPGAILPDLPFLSRSDEYSLRLESNDWRLSLGDQALSFLPLTQSYAHGVGVSASGERGLVRASAMALRDRGFRQAREEGSLSLAIGDAATSAGVTLLRRRGAPDSGTVGTVQVKARLPLHSDASLEYGLAAHGVSASGIEIRGGNGVAGYAVRHTSSDASFPSGMRGRESDFASASLKLPASLRVQASTYRSTSSLERVGFSSWWDMRDEAAWQATLARGELALEGFGRARSDLAGNSVAQQGVRARASQRLGVISYSTSAERSILSDASASLRTPAVRFAGRLQLHANGQALSLGLERASSTILGSRIMGPSRILSVETHLESSMATRFDAVFQRRVSNERLLDDESAEVGVRQKLMLGQELELRARRNLFTGAYARSAPELLLSYHVPFAVPAGRSQSVAAVSVEVRDESSGRGVSGIVVRLGDRTGLSDADGRASFPDLTPGAYTLDGDIAARGLVVTSQRQLPLQVRADGGVRREIVLSVARQATVVSRIHVPAESAALDGESRALPGATRVVMLLANGADTLRRVVDADERAQFTGLRPGRWLLLVDRLSLPRHYRVVGDSVAITLAAGVTRETTLELVQSARPMVIVAEQVVRQTGAADRMPARPAAPAERESKSKSESESKSEAAPHYYVVGNGERTLEDVARWVYGDASMWPRLWAANSAEPGLPDRLERGALLRVPPAAPLSEDEKLLARRRPSGCKWAARTTLGAACP